MRKMVLLIATVLLMGADLCDLAPQDCFRDAGTVVTPTEWDILISALIEVESRGDTLAVGPTNDLGALQITPIYVREVNRISGRGYTLEDRASLIKTLEMFEIYQSYYNPDRDIDRAIYLHNPGAGEWYRNKVYRCIEEIKKNV